MINISYSLGRISDPVSSKACLKGGTPSNENGGFGKVPSRRLQRRIIVRRTQYALSVVEKPSLPKSSERGGVILRAIRYYIAHQSKPWLDRSTPIRLWPLLQLRQSGRESYLYYSTLKLPYRSINRTVLQRAPQKYQVLRQPTKNITSRGATTAVKTHPKTPDRGASRSHGIISQHHYLPYVHSSWGQAQLPGIKIKCTCL